MLNGVLWVLGTGEQWSEMPEEYPPYQTCHRRLQQRVRSSKLDEALKQLARLLHARGQLNLEEAFVDATFASAKKGASPLVPPVAARARKSLLSPLITVFLSPYLSTALCRPGASLWNTFWPEASSTIFGPLDRRLHEEYGVEMIAPNRRNRSSSQDGRKLRRYCRRWKVERLFAWLHNFRRLVTRWEYHIENFLGFGHLACLHMLLRHL